MATSASAREALRARHSEVVRTDVALQSRATAKIYTTRVGLSDFTPGQDHPTAPFPNVGIT